MNKRIILITQIKENQWENAKNIRTGKPLTNVKNMKPISAGTVLPAKTRRFTANTGAHAQFISPHKKDLTKRNNLQ